MAVSTFDEGFIVVTKEDASMGIEDYVCLSASSHIYFIFYSLHYEKFQDGTVKCIEDEMPF
ncbi:MAG TPA: hypothetical protein H9909_04190, partial [Candidatus Mediterraneibacter norfolkensis]|nr:hypothetical protein [Candidatus Mediterraneibacter norfolkensis]